MVEATQTFLQCIYTTIVWQSCILQLIQDA